MQELAIHGTRVTFCFSCRVDDAHQTSSEFLKDHPFSRCLWFPLLVCLLCLGKKAITRGFSYFFSYKCKWQSERIFEKERKRDDDGVELQQKRTTFFHLGVPADTVMIHQHAERHSVCHAHKHTLKSFKKVDLIYYWAYFKNIVQKM